MSAPIRLFICDGDPMFRECILEAIHSEPDMKVVGMAGFAHQLLQAVEDFEIDLIVLEMALPQGSGGGIEAAISLKAKKPQIPIIVLSHKEDEKTIAHAFGYGQATNYITKQFHRDLVRAIRDAVKGEIWIHPSSSRQLIRHLSSANRLAVKNKLSSVQQDILVMLSEGRSVKETAEALFYNEQSIYNELSKIAKYFREHFPFVEGLQERRLKTKQILELAQGLKLFEESSDITANVGF